jgi:hypothetical protein
LFELSATYGSGWFREGNDHKYRIANPCSKWFRRHVKTWQPTYAELKANGVHAPFPGDMHPADPGLLCVGHGDGRIALFLSFRGRRPDGTVVALTFQERWLRVSSDFVPFFTAVLRGDVDLLGLPEAKGGRWVFEPDGPTDPAVLPTVLEAALRDDLEEVRALVAGGADPNCKGADGGTPLCSVDEEPMVRLLLALGADPDLADGSGRTPLTVACSSHLPLGGLRALLEAGANPNQQDSSGQTPLLLACGFRDVAEVQLLLQFGADPNRADGNGRTPLRVARKRPEIQLVLRAAGAV